jgi:chromosome segregation ATPase
MIACEVQYHSDGRSAGHGVVIYETIEDAEKALVGTNGYRLEGRTIEASGWMRFGRETQQQTE